MNCGIGNYYGNYGFDSLTHAKSILISPADDRMASFLAAYGNSDALAVARNLDKKVEGLLLKAAAGADHT